jgi:hypothetical protein
MLNLVVRKETARLQKVNIGLLESCGILHGCVTVKGLRMFEIKLLKLFTKLLT